MANLAATLFTSLHAGNGNVLPLISEKAKGCGYYGQTNGMHTVQFSTTNTFIGKILIQGSLEVRPTEDDWFDIDHASLGDGTTPVTNQSVITNFAGNFVWVRAVIISFSAGDINRVQFTHN